MYCKYCGQQIDENSQFCKFCGKKLVETQNVRIEFTKPKVFENIHSYFRKQFQKYRLFFQISDETDLIFGSLFAIVCIVVLHFITGGIMYFIFNVFSINSNDVPFFYCTILVIIEFILLFNWVVSYTIKNHH